MEMERPVDGGEMSCGRVSRIARQRGLPGAPPEVRSLLRAQGVLWTLNQM